MVEINLNKLSPADLEIIRVAGLRYKSDMPDQEPIEQLLDEITGAQIDIAKKAHSGLTREVGSSDMSYSGEK